MDEWWKSTCEGFALGEERINVQFFDVLKRERWFANSNRNAAEDIAVLLQEVIDE